MKRTVTLLAELTQMNTKLRKVEQKIQDGHKKLQESGISEEQIKQCHLAPMEDESWISLDCSNGVMSYTREIKGDDSMNKSFHKNHTGKPHSNALKWVFLLNFLDLCLKCVSQLSQSDWFWSRVINAKMMIKKSEL